MGYISKKVAAYGQFVLVYLGNDILQHVNDNLLLIPISNKTHLFNDPFPKS